MTTTFRSSLRGAAAGAVLCLLLAAQALASDLEVQLDRTRVEEGESVQLLIREQGSGSGAQPDLSPLREDFEVQDVAQSQRMEIRNGDMQRSHDWIVSLVPQRTGRLEIPALRVGAQETQTLALEVAAAGAPPDALGAPASPAAPAVFVEAEVDDPRPYVQGRTLLSVRVHAREGIVEASLEDPEIPGAIVERIGDDTRETRSLEGHSYDVVLRRYSVVPQRSGRLTIAPIALEAVVREAAPRRARSFGGAFGDPFRDFFGGDPFAGMLPRAGSLIDEFFGARSRRVRAHSDALLLDVQPVPAGVALSDWLPARHLELRESWQPEPSAIRVGEQLTRSLTLRGAGVAAAQLPELDATRVEGLKEYPEPASSADREIAGELWSVKRQDRVLVPTQPGPLVLPAIEVPWYDIDAKVERVARLPERTLDVLPAPGSAAPATPAPAPAAQPAAQAAPPPAPPAAAAFWDPRALAGLGSALALGVALAAFAFRRRSRRAAPEQAPSAGPTQPDARPREAAAAFERACRASDANGAASSLVAWGRARWPESPPNTPGEVAARLGDAALRAEVDALNAVRYSAGASSWSGDALLAAWRAARDRKVARAARPEGALPALYPTR